MWFKDKLVRNLIIGAIVIALLVGVYVLIQNIPDGNTPPADTPQSQGVTVYSMDSTKIETVYIKNASDEYTIVKAEDGYEIKNHPGIEFSEETIENSVYMFSSLYAAKEIEDPDVSQYGFDDPAAKAVISGGGEENTIYIGNRMIGEDGYFLLHKESERVYVLPSSLVISFMLEVNDYRPTEIASADIHNIEKMNVKKDGKTLVNIRRINEDEADKFSMFTSFVMTTPHYASIQNDALTEVAVNMGSISVSKYVEDNPKNLSKYGLDKPKYVLEFADAAGNGYTVSYGNKTETGTVYAMVSGKNFVFEQDIAIYNSLSQIQILRLVERYAHIIDLYEVSEITISGENINHKIVITGDDKNKKFMVNGVNAEPDKFKELYQAIIGIDVSGFAKDTNGGREVAKIEFKLNNGRSVVARYLTYDDRNYALERNGVIQSTVLKQNLENMISKLNDFAKNLN